MQFGQLIQSEQLKTNLISGLNCGWMMEDHDVALELPAGLRVDLRRDHDHAFPDLRSLDFLQSKGGSLSTPNFCDRHPEKKKAFLSYCDSVQL